jgi:hypothetical protein
MFCNFTPPTNKTFNSNFNEVTTLFHEFGTYADVSQYDLSKFVWNFSYWILWSAKPNGNFAAEPEALALFAKALRKTSCLGNMYEIKESASFL